MDAVNFGFCVILLFLQPEKQGNSKSLKQILFYFIYLFIYFFAIAPNASPISYAIQSEKEAQVDGTKKIFQGERLFERGA